MKSPSFRTKPPTFRMKPPTFQMKPSSSRMKPPSSGMRPPSSRIRLPTCRMKLPSRHPGTLNKRRKSPTCQDDRSSDDVNGPRPAPVPPMNICTPVGNLDARHGSRLALETPRTHNTRPSL